MENSISYTERFIMHTELYMLLTGKHAQELSIEDMERIGQLIDPDRYKANYKTEQ